MLFEIDFTIVERLLIIRGNDGPLLQGRIFGDTLQDRSSLRVGVYQPQGNVFVVQYRHPRVLSADHDILSLRVRGVQRQVR